MQTPSRRALLGAVATAAVAGCVNVLGEQEGCDLEGGTWRGAAGSITTTVTVGEGETTERAAARAAAEAAFAHLDERLDVDLAEKRWIAPGVSHSEAYDAFVRVREVHDREGDVRLCPDSAFDVDDARAALPGRVVVTVRSGETGGPNEYSHDIELVSARQGLD